MFEPVGVTFISGLTASSGMREAYEDDNKTDPLRKLFVIDHDRAPPERTVNLLVHHGSAWRWNTRTEAP